MAENIQLFWVLLDSEEDGRRAALGHFVMTRIRAETRAPVYLATSSTSFSDVGMPETGTADQIRNASGSRRPAELSQAP